MTSLAHPTWIAEILEQMDDCARQYDFPMFNNSTFQYARARLCAYANEDEWLIIFQILNYSPSPRRFFNDIYGYGNQLSRPGHQRTLALFDDDRSWWDEQRFVLDVHHPRLQLRSGARTFEISDLDYASRRIAIARDDQKPIGLLRYLVDVIPDELFVASDALLDCCNRPRGLHRALALDDWQHPDVAEDQLPSSSASLRDLATFLAGGTTAPPSGSGNTDWRLWT
jgi:hypothetical protein